MTERNEHYTPETLRLLDLHAHRIHLRDDAQGRCEVYVAARYVGNREVVLWEEGSGYLGERWLAIAEAVCGWLNLPEDERRRRRAKEPL